VLAVVQAHAVALEGVGGAAEAAPDLDERHARAGIGAVERRRDPRQTAADHDDALPAEVAHGSRLRAHAALPAKLRSATSSFSALDSEVRALSAAGGSASIRPSRRW
jgi:hypothetical protein